MPLRFGYLVDHTDSILTPSPLMQITMELDDNELVFNPALDFKQKDSFLDLIEDILTDIKNQATLIERVKLNDGANYLEDIEANDELAEMKDDIEDRVQKVMNLAYEYTQRFEPYEIGRAHV